MSALFNNPEVLKGYKPPFQDISTCLNVPLPTCSYLDGLTSTLFSSSWTSLRCHLLKVASCLLHPTILHPSTPLYSSLRHWLLSGIVCVSSVYHTRTWLHEGRDLAIFTVVAPPLGPGLTWHNISSRWIFAERLSECPRRRSARRDMGEMQASFCLITWSLYRKSSSGRGEGPGVLVASQTLSPGGRKRAERQTVKQEMVCL